MNYLLFQCYAPLVSWGEIAVGGERLSSRQPSKSAIIGLLAAALGIRRDEDERMKSLTDSVGFAVQMHSGGTVLKDFHTVQTPKAERKVVYHTRKDEMNAPNEKIGTILSRREYRCDALSVVAVWLNTDAFTLEELANALRFPTFQLYLGRKSCPPAAHLNPEIILKDTLKGAFNAYSVNISTPEKDKMPDWEKAIYKNYPQNTLSNGDTITYFWEKCDHAGFIETHKTPRYDHPLSRKRWQFTYREEYMAVEKRKEVEDVSQ